MIGVESPWLALAQLQFQGLIAIRESRIASCPGHEFSNASQKFARRKYRSSSLFHEGACVTDWTRPSKSAQLRAEPAGLHPVTVREIDPPSREGYGAASA